MQVESERAFRSLDGLVLRGTMALASPRSGPPTVLVHGGGVTRNEGGFFARLAAGLSRVGLPSLRFDLRGHGQSEGSQEDLTIAGLLNDIRTAMDLAMAETEDSAVNLVGASFAGGICASFAACHPEQVRRLVLLNPLLNYKKRFIDDKPYWTDDHLDPEAAQELAQRGFLAHSPTFKLGRPLLNEVFHLRPDEELHRVQVPTLFIHGTRDTFIPVDSSRRAADQVGGMSRLLEIDGAQHGFAIDGDPLYQDPQTQTWQSEVIDEITAWLGDSQPDPGR